MRYLVVVITELTSNVRSLQGRVTLFTINDDVAAAETNIETYLPEAAVEAATPPTP